MRRKHKLWWILALGAGLAACTQDGPGETREGGDATAEGDASGSDAAPQPDASRADAMAADAAQDAAHGDAGPRDAGAGSDAERPRDAAQDASDAAQSSEAGANTDAGAGGSGCAGKTYKLCEDFESANEGTLPSGWTTVNAWGGGTCAVASDEAHSGSKSLKGSNTVNGQTRVGKSLSSLGATANKHWGRVFYKVRSPASLPPAVDPPNHPVLHNTIVALKGATESRVVDTIVNAQGKNQFIYNLPDDSCCMGSEYLYTSYDGKWHCAEWYLDSGAKQFRFYFEGTEVTSLKFDPSKAQLGNYTQVIVGWIGYQTSKMPYNQAWIDDLAIDDSRIGCD